MTYETVRIVSCEPSNGQQSYSRSTGTKVFAGTSELKGVVAIDVHYRIDELVSADITLFSAGPDDVTAIPQFLVIDPQTGKAEKVQTILFANGKRIDFLC